MVDLELSEDVGVTFVDVNQVYLALDYFIGVCPLQYLSSIYFDCSVIERSQDMHDDIRIDITLLNHPYYIIICLQKRFNNKKYKTSQCKLLTT